MTVYKIKFRGYASMICIKYADIRILFNSRSLTFYLTITLGPHHLSDGLNHILYTSY